mgnify:CR=1 FL=1
MSDGAAPTRVATGRWAYPLAALAGAVAGLGQVPFALPPVALVALALAARIAWRAAGPRRAAWVGLATGTGYFAVTLHWIVEPFFVDVARHGWMAPFALVFMAVGFGAFWAAAFALARWLGGGGRRFAPAFALSLAGVELLRTYLLTGFPWALLGYVWTETPAAQLASWIGPHGLTLLTALAVGIAAVASGWLRPAMGLVSLWALVMLGGMLVPPAPEATADAPVLRLVQPNAPQDRKWDPDHAQTYFRRLLDATADRGVGSRPDLVVWPETAIPYSITPGHPALDFVADAAGGVPVAFGVQRIDGARIYNSLLLLGPEGGIDDTYDKHHLVPFGEFIPLGSLARYLGLRSFAAQDGYGYSAGPGPRLMDFGPLGRALPLICYEAIFPQDVSGAPERPDWLLQVTNDAWFGTFAGPQQSLAQARMRSIEQGLPMVRVANTGISAVIDARGRVLASLPLGETGYFDHPLPPAGAPTVYARTGDWPWMALILLGLAGLGLAMRRERHLDMAG